MKPTNRDVKIIYGSSVVTADNDEHVVANCGGYQSNRKGEDAHAENIANAELIAAAWNVLRALNPTDPLAAANALPGVVAALEDLLEQSEDECESFSPNGENCQLFYIDQKLCVQCAARAALTALKGETDG